MSLAVRLPLIVGYLLMVGLNIYASQTYQRKATSGFQYSYAQPDPPTFGIWGLIYTGLLATTVMGTVPRRAVKGLLLSFLLNATWLVANGEANSVRGNEVPAGSYWYTVAILFSYVGVLLHVYFTVDVDYSRSEASALTKSTLFAPISMNLAWIVVASAVNLSNTLFDPSVDFFVKGNSSFVAPGGPDWAAGVCGLAAILSLVAAVNKADFVFAATIAWAIGGVYRNQAPSSGDFPHPVSESLRGFAWTQMGVSFVAVAVALIAAFAPMPRVQAVEASQAQVEPENKVSEETLSQPIIRT